MFSWFDRFCIYWSFNVYELLPECLRDTNKSRWNGHTNFNPVINHSVEHRYPILKIKKQRQKYRSFTLIFGITEHASFRMTQRQVTRDMIAHTLKYGTIEHEGPQKHWDNEGRIVFTWDNMVVITNRSKNRIVTVYWKIDNWCNIERTRKTFIQKKVRREWCRKYSKFYKKNKIYL